MIDMVNNSDDTDDEMEDDGITININSDGDTDTDDVTNESSDSDTGHDQFDEDFLRDDGTIVVENDEYEGRIRLVGTVHVSKETRDRVESTIEEEQSDVVAIELDDERLSEMFKRGADVVGGDAEGGSNDGFSVTDILRKQQQEQFDGEDFLEPGEADMLPALDRGVEYGSDVALIDMPVDELKSNVKSNAFDDSGNLDLDLLNKSFGEIREAVGEFVSSRSDMASQVEEDGISAVVEQMENSSLSEVKGQMDPLRNIAPEVIEALIDERDKHMAGHLHWLRQNGYDVTAVMGRGHLPGVYDYLQNPETIPEEYVAQPDWYNYSKVSLN